METMEIMMEIIFPMISNNYGIVLFIDESCVEIKMVAFGSPRDRSRK
jgi:hypothetical protein